MTTLSSGGPAPGAPAGRPTMREVAALAGVSLKTVSRVVNGEPGVSDDLADRVNRAAAELGYQRDLTASSLRRSDRRTNTLGLLLEDVANPFFSALHRGVEDAARERGVAVYAASVDEDEQRQHDLAMALIARRVDALVVAPTGIDHSYMRPYGWTGVLVFADREPTGIEADVVVADNRGGSATAVEHLIERGHRRVAFIGDMATISTAEQRYLGYVDALRSRGIELRPELVLRDVHSEREAEVAVRRLLALPEPPTALYCAQNLITMGAIAALREAGLRHRIALVGFDDFRLADQLEPPITVVSQDARLMGRTAVELAYARLEHPTRPYEHLVLPAHLVVRGSGEIPPASR